MSDGHITIGDDSEYELTVHPAFASACTVTNKATGQARKLYEQDRTKPVDVRANGHPKKHRIVLKGKNGKKRNVTITVDDPDHAIASLSFSLYEESHDPTVQSDSASTESVEVINDAHTCPPYC